MKLISQVNDDYSFTPLFLTKRLTMSVLNRHFGDNVQGLEPSEASIIIRMKDGSKVQVIEQHAPEICRGGNVIIQIGICSEKYEQELLEYFEGMGYVNVPYDYTVNLMKKI
jgi:hypothetical protein